ncbi:hypothetical protein Tco_0552932 [Tanacetum coccineum]
MPIACDFVACGSIMDIKSVLTQKALKTFCETFHIPDEVHPQLPSPNQTIHEMPTGKIEMDLLSFIWTANLIKVRVGERKHDEDEPMLLDATVGPVVPLLLIVPARGQSELEDSMDKLFGEGGSRDQVEQGDSASCGQGVGIQFVSEAAEVVVEDGKSRLVVQRSLARAVQNAEVRGEIVPTLPFVTSSVSATPEREDETRTDSVAGTNLQNFGPPPSFVISSNSSHHSDANVAEAEVDSIVRSSAPVMTTATIVTTTVDATTVLKETSVKPSLFAAGSSSTGGNEPILGGFSDLTGNDFLVVGIHTVINSDSDLQKVYVPQWNVTNKYRLDDGGVCREMIDEFAPLKFFVSIRGMEHDQIFTEFNQTEVLKAKEKEIEDLRAQLLLKEAKAVEAIRLRAKLSQCKVVEKSLRDDIQALRGRNTTLEKENSELDVKVTDLAASVKNDNQADREKVTVYEDCMSQLEKFQDERMRVMNDKFNKLYTDFVEMTLHLEEKFYPHLLTTIAGHRWLLTYDMKLAIVKCLHSPEYLSTLRVAISKAIKKGMQDRLAAGITHGQEGRALTADVNFSLLAELKSNKGASVETLMDILRLEETLADRLGLNEAQPHVNSYDMFVPLVKPLSSDALEGTEGTSGAAPDTTMALSTTYAFASSVPPILTDDYVVVHVDSQEGAGADVNPLPNVDDAELNIS